MNPMWPTSRILRRAFQRLARRVPYVLCVIVCLTVTSAVHADNAGRAKRVLMVHSFGSSAPPFTTHSTAFETTLTQEMGNRVDLDEISLDNARYGQPDMEEPFVEFLLKRLAKWQPDLVVPIGSPAGRFLVKFRDRLFPGTPVIYTGMDRRTVPPDAITKNATFVGEDFELAGLVEDILQIAPDTTNIEVILGATLLERYWAIEFRRAFERFTNRVSFNFLNDLSFDQMLERLAKLPPRSFILLGLLLRDASGVTHNEDDALQRLHAVANAPINGLYKNQLGLGIVGGRLYQGELQGVESASIAIRVLRGEPISNFPPKVIGTVGPRYDWRELQRWNISEDRLPPGSVIVFRQPTMWEQYIWYIIVALSIIAIQATMIGNLLLHRARRRRAEVDLKESYDRTQDLAGRLITAQEAERSRIASELHDDVNQQLAGLSIALSNVKRQLQNGGTGNVQEEITRLQQRTIGLADVIRSLSHELHPGVLQHAGLIAALKGHCAEFGKQHEIDVNLSADADLDGIPNDVALCLFRVAQEALRNITAHAAAHKAQISLKSNDEGLELVIADDGQGFDLAEARRLGGLGLISLDERVRLVGGNLVITTEPQRGTEVRVRVPLGGNR
jgi:signal transduction histidine kinase